MRSGPVIRGRRASLLLAGEEATGGTALREGVPTVVGRASPSDLVVEDRGLSRQHARFTWKGDVLLLEDLGSTNGTFVNGARVRQTEVGPDDEVVLGSVRALVHLSRYARQPPSVAPDAFRAAVEQELVRARTFGRSCAVLALRGEGMGDGGAGARLRGALRPVDRVGAVGHQVAVTLLSEASEAELEGWRERLAAAVEGESYSLAVGASVFPVHGDAADALIAAAVDAARRARPGGEVTLARGNAERPVSAGGAVVESPGMRRLYDLVRRAARTAIPVLIVGETGSGKELVARTLHEESPRSSGPFKAINCATIPASLTESVLFGHERGAFTGAHARAAGVFEQADGGTVFLDEVGELPPQAQAALLRVLETKRLTRVGGSREIEVDVRVVAATHRNLEWMVDEGTFRADLLYRLDALTLEVPPLRERLEDIVPLARTFLHEAAEQWQTPAADLDESVLDAVCAYPWPGNVRQLKNAMERAAAMALGSRIGLGDLPKDVARAAAAEVPRCEDAPAQEAGLPLTERVDRFERRILRDALERTGGNQTRAAELLRVPRRTLAHKVQRHGLG
ncbi:MAG: sigma 54-interacting transcriptional regulator [Myxococcota bacterium]